MNTVVTHFLYVSTKDRGKSVNELMQEIIREEQENEASYSRV